MGENGRARENILLNRTLFFGHITIHLWITTCAMPLCNIGQGNPVTADMSDTGSRPFRI